MHPLLRAAAERQLGVFTAADARRAGYAESEIRRLCSSGQWARLRRGVYVRADALAAAVETGSRHRIDCAAALLGIGRPTSVISHASAARLWGMPVRRGSDPQLRLTDPHQWRRGPNFAMTCAPLPAADVADRAPIRLTTPARTLVDCAREWPLEDAVVAMDAALLAQRVEVGELQTAAAAARLWRGGPRAVRAVALADGRAESPLETLGRLRIVGAGLVVPELQVEIRRGTRLVGVVDAWFDDAAVAVEFDGRIKYTDPWRGRSPGQVLWEEKRREDELRALDIRIVRIADADVGPPTWAAVEARLRGLLSSPGPAVRGFTAVPRSRGLRRTG